MCIRDRYYTKPTQDSPIYEYFSFNYFPEFESVSDTDLPDIVKFCEANATDVDQSAAIKAPTLSLMETGSNFTWPATLALSCFGARVFASSEHQL